MDRIGNYKIIGPHAALREATYSTLVLDANVLLDIRNFYFGTSRSREVRASLEALLSRFPMKRREHVDINYGWAATELSWRRGEGHDPIGHRRLIHAASQVLSWDAETIRKEFASSRPPVDRDKAWPRVPLRVADDVADPRVMLIAPYGALLFMLTLEQRRTERASRGREWALRTYVDWVTNVLGVRIPYALALSIGLFAGSAQAQKETRAIFKLSGAENNDQLAKMAWNVAWDISMTSLGEGLSYGLLPGVAPTAAALVTRDADPRLLRLTTETKTVIDTGSEKIPFAAFGMDPHRSVSVDTIHNILELDPLDGITRFVRDPELTLRQAVAAVNSLEQQLGVTKMTMFDGWQL